MAETKDKIVTVESLSTLHEHNKETYMTKANPTGSGVLTITGDDTSGGDGMFGGNGTFGGFLLVKGKDKDGNPTGTPIAIDPITGFKLLVTARIEGGLCVDSSALFCDQVTIQNGLNVDGNIILTSNQYGDTLPESSENTVGRIFFKKLSE